MPLLNPSVILERNEKCLERNETCLARNKTSLARNETRGGKLILSRTVHNILRGLLGLMGGLCKVRMWTADGGQGTADGGKYRKYI